MTPVLLGLLVTMGVAVAIVLGVALPHLRQGSKILSDEGEQRVRELRRRVGPTAAEAAPDPARDTDPADGQPAAGYGTPQVGYGPSVGYGPPAVPPPPAAGAARQRWAGLAGSATAAMTRARDAFDGAARRAGHAADRVDVPGSAFGDSAEQVGERVRRGMSGALRWLGTRPERVRADPDAPVTATAPHGLPVLTGDLLPPEAPRTPEVGIPADPAVAQPDGPGGQHVIDLRDRPIGLTIDLRDLPQMPPLDRPVPVRGPRVREDGESATAEHDDRHDDLADELHDLDDLDGLDGLDDEVHVGPRHAR